MNNAPRIILLTGHKFGAAFLCGLADSAPVTDGGLKISAVYGLHPSEAPTTVGYIDIGSVARKYGIGYSYFSTVRSENLLSELQLVPHEYLLAIGLSQLLPESFLQLPRCHVREENNYGPGHAVIGAHPTLLPIGRGRAPIPWTILRRLETTGVTLFVLDAEADSGPIIDVEPLAITSNTTAAELFADAERAHSALASRVAVNLANRSLIGEPQIGPASTWPKRTPSDSWLDFARPVSDLLLLVRAVARPYHLAFFVSGDTIVRVASAKAQSGIVARPGTILDATPDFLAVQAADGVFVANDWCLEHPATAPIVGSQVASSLENSIC